MADRRDDRLHRILNIVRFPIGGIRNYLAYTYSRLDPWHYASTVVTVDRQEAALLAAGMAPMRVDVTTVPEKRAPLHLARATRGLLSTGRYAVVHSQGSTAAVIGAAATFRRGLPHVVTLHETFDESRFAGWRGEAKRHLLARALNRAEAVIAVSEDARDNLLAHVPLRADAQRRLEVIPNGVSVDALRRAARSSRAELRRRAGLPDDVTLLGYIGRFMPEKGFDVVVEAVRRLAAGRGAASRFSVIAVNDGAFIREYRQHVRELQLDPWFTFLGLQPSAASTLVEVDAVMVPSRREACPLVAMEAMVLGCPLIASDCLGLREVTRRTPAIRTVAGDPGSLAEAIATFLATRSQVRASALAFVDTAIGRFDSRVTAARLSETFSRAMQRQRAPARATRA